MYLDPITLIVIAISMIVVNITFLGVFFQFYLKPRTIAKVQSEKNDLEQQIRELNKKLTEFAGAERLEKARNVDRSQNVSIMIIRALIVKFIRWERPSRELRIILSIATAFGLAWLLSYLIRTVHTMIGLDFWFVLIVCYLISYYIWGTLIEIHWKQKQMGLLKAEFMKLLKMSSNPLSVRDGLISWMTSSIDVPDKIRRMIEGNFDVWLRENLKKELGG